MLDLHRLRALLAVREHGGIPAAARALSLVPADVDELVTGLERQLGLPLLDGEPRGLRLTAAGQQLAAHTQRALAELEAAEAGAAAAIGRVAGLVRIGVTPAAARALLPDALGRLFETAPDVEIRIEQLGTDESLAGIVAGTLDVAVIGEYGMVPRQLDPELERRDLVVEPVLVAVPARHPASGPTIRLAELGRDRWVGAAADSPALELLHRGCGVAGVQPQVIAHCADDALALTLVAAGMGLALVPASAADQHGGPDRRLEGIRLLTPVDPSLRRTVTAVGRRSAAGDPAVSRLLDALATAGRRFVDVTPGASRPAPAGLGAEPPAAARPAAERTNGHHPAILPPPGAARPGSARPGTPVVGRGPVDVPNRPYSPPGRDLPPLRPVAGDMTGDLPPLRPGSGPADIPGLPVGDLPPLRPVNGPGDPPPLRPVNGPVNGPGDLPGFPPGDLPPLRPVNGNHNGDVPPLRPFNGGPAELPGFGDGRPVNGGPGDLPFSRPGELPPSRPGELPSRSGDLPRPGELPGPRSGEPFSRPGDLPSRSGDLPPLRSGDLPRPGELPGPRSGDLPSRSGDLPPSRPGDLPSSRGGELPSSRAGDLPPLRPRGGPPNELPGLKDLPPLRPPGGARGGPNEPPGLNDLPPLRPPGVVPPARSGSTEPRAPGGPPTAPRGSRAQPDLPEVRPPADPPGEMPRRRAASGLSGGGLFRAGPADAADMGMSSDLGARSLPAADLPIPRSAGDLRRPGASGPGGSGPGGRRSAGPDQTRPGHGPGSLSRRTRAESRAARGAEGPEGTLPPAPDQDVRLSIFEELQSEWFSRRRKDDPLGMSPEQAPWGSSPADDGWRAAARLASPTTAGTTTAGLPKRVPQALFVPGAVGGESNRPPNGAPARSAQDVRGRLSSYRDGVRRGRHSERPPGEDDQP